MDERPIRLHLYIARCGVASRRASETIILAGRVRVNGETVRSLGVKVSEADKVELDGRVLTPESRYVYLAVNKPPGFLCSAVDQRGRPLVKELLPESITERVFTIGRLDFRSSGLLLLTNDGSFAARISHPSAGIEKEYLVDSSVPIPDLMIENFQTGLNIEGEFYRCHEVERLGKRSVRIVLVEGKNKEIRRVFSAFHLHPERLIRLRIGPILLGSLAEGRTRFLSAAEVESLDTARRGVHQ